jgi:hypothetical protein
MDLFGGSPDEYAEFVADYKDRHDELDRLKQELDTADN